MIVPGGGISLDGTSWIAARPAFLLPVRVLGALYRRLFLTRLMALHDAGRLAFFGQMAHLTGRRALLRHLSPVRKKRWVVYAKPPFAGPEAVLAYLSRYTHRVAISNSRLLRFDEAGVTFRYKDDRRGGTDRQQVMTLAGDEFIRRFLLHALPRGSHRIRHYGLLASGTRRISLERARTLLAVAPPLVDDPPLEPAEARPPCPCCGGRMVIIETFERRYQPRAPPSLIVASGSPRRDPARHIVDRPRYAPVAGDAKPCVELPQKRTHPRPSLLLRAHMIAHKAAGPFSDPSAYRQPPPSPRAGQSPNPHR